MGTRFAADTRVVVLTISDSCSRGTQVDRSGPAVVELLEAAGVAAVVTETLPDELDLIAAALRRHAANAGLVVTTGGTGLAARDVTPEATRLVCERLVEGLAERMRAAGLEQTPFAALSRGVCGTVSEPGGTATLIVNLPGSVGGATSSLAAILPLAAACAGSAGGTNGTLMLQVDSWRLPVLGQPIRREQLTNN